MTAPMGRPSKLTPELLKALCGYLEEGMPRESACAMVSIDYSTFWRWWQRDVVDFRNAIQKAEAVWELATLRRIDTAGATKTDGSWQAYAWRLERRWPLRYAAGARRVEAEVTAQVMAKLSALPIETREAVANAFEASVDNGSMAEDASVGESAQREQ